MKDPLYIDVQGMGHVKVRKFNYLDRKNLLTKV
jgi:hypothetical protein